MYLSVAPTNYVRPSTRSVPAHSAKFLLPRQHLPFQNRCISSSREPHILKKLPRSKQIILSPPRYASFAKNLPLPPTCRILPNGATLVTHPLSQSKISTVGVWMKFGSRISSSGYDTEGLVHFMEHMIFKGTKTRSKHDIEKRIEDIGAHLNAYTTKEHVAYFGNCLGSDSQEMLELILDLLQNSSFTSSSVRDEISTILRESHEVNLIAEEVLLDKVHEHCFGVDSDLGKPILGSTAAIRNTTKSSLNRLMKEMYIPSNMVIMAVGDIDPVAIEKVINNTFTRVRTPKTETFPQPAKVPIFNGDYALYVQQTLDLYLKEPTLLVARTCPGVPWNSQSFFTSILGRMMIIEGSTESGEPTMVQGTRTRVPTSLQSLSEISHYLPFDAFYRDCGLFGTYSLERVPEECLKDIPKRPRMAQMSNTAKAEIKKTACEAGHRVRESLKARISSWTQADLDQAKELCISMFAATVNNPILEPEELGRQILAHGRLCSHESISSQIQNVTLSQVKRLLDSLLINPPATAITALLRMPLMTSVCQET